MSLALYPSRVRSNDLLGCTRASREHELGGMPSELYDTHGYTKECQIEQPSGLGACTPTCEQASEYARQSVDCDIEREENSCQNHRACNPGGAGAQWSWTNATLNRDRDEARRNEVDPSHAD